MLSWFSKQHGEAMPPCLDEPQVSNGYLTSPHRQTATLGLTKMLERG